MKSKSGGGSSNPCREVGLRRRGGTRAAGGVVATRAVRAGADRTPRRVCCLSVREGVGVGKGGAVSRGEPAGGGAAVRAPGPQKAALTVEAVNRLVTAVRTRGTSAASSSPGLRGGAAGGVSGAGAGRSPRGQRPGPGRAVGGRAWCGVGAGLGGGRGRRDAGAAQESLTSTLCAWAEGRRLARGGAPAGLGDPSRVQPSSGPSEARAELGTSRSRWAPGLIVTQFE